MARVIRRILGGWVLGSGTETAGALACSAVLALPFTDAPDLHRCFSAEAASSTATKVCVVGGGPGGFYVTDKVRSTVTVCSPSAKYCVRDCLFLCDKPLHTSPLSFRYRTCTMHRCSSGTVRACMCP